MRLLGVQAVVTGGLIGMAVMPWIVAAVSGSVQMQANSASGIRRRKLK